MEERSEVRERILQAATKLFFDQGVAGTPLRAIAAAAGTSESGVLRFFRDKNDLAQTVMGQWWAQVNELIATALRTSLNRGDDPRTRLTEVVKAILEQAAVERPSTRFLVSHFNYSLSGPSRSGLQADDYQRLHPYHKYRSTIDGLCAEVVSGDPNLGRTGITQAGLCHLVLSLIYGITGGWYLSEQDPDVHGPPLPVEDALAILRKVIY